MAYKPNPNREIVDGKAKVSAKELADFQSKYGDDKTLRDLLNADKGLVRRGEKPAEKSYENKVKFDPASYSAFPLETSMRRTEFRQKAADLGKKYAKGGSVKLSEAARRGDGIAIRGRTKGKLY